MTTTRYEYQLNYQYLFDLNIVAPRQQYSPASDYQELGNGDQVERGYATIEWYWAFLDDDSWDVLSAAVGDCVIRSLDDSLAWHNFHVKMLRPKSAPDVESDHRMKVTFKFNILEQLD